MHQLSVSARRIWSDSICGGLLLARGTNPFAFDRNVKKIHVQIGQSVRIKAMLPSSYHDIMYESDWQ